VISIDTYHQVFYSKDNEMIPIDGLGFPLKIVLQKLSNSNNTYMKNIALKKGNEAVYYEEV
jgi:hypothetical protein